ncbi:putative F-box protein At3g23970 [Silene latifolia]|uniref:putative F-box protein At3g23970 n=1 Tax=Silene latifolia TaxID=37657 RepID=UPI003D76F0D3
MSSYLVESPESLFDQLLDELIIEILTRIPSKSVCRIKSVSKRFNSIISHPRFLPIYVSRVSLPVSWVILDRIPQLAPESTHPTQFQLVDRPKISTFAINPIKLVPDPVTDSTQYVYPAEILQSSNGLILFTLLNKRDLFKDDPENREDPEDPDSDPGIFEEEVLYVVNPISNEWVGIPETRRLICERRNVGFTARVDPETGVVGRFMVVEYRPLIGPECGTFLCFASDTGKWVEKVTDFVMGMRIWRAEGAFEFEGKLFWVDLSMGLITWDVKDNDYFREVENKEKAVCRLIPVPEGRDKPFDTFGLEDERFVGVGGGFVQFMEVFKEDDCGLKVWRLNNCEVGGEWSLMYKVSRENVQRFLTCETGRHGGGGGGGGGGMLYPCFVHPFEADIVYYFVTGDCIISFNLRTQKVENDDVFASHPFVVPFLLPKWPSPIPNRLCV